MNHSTNYQCLKVLIFYSQKQFQIFWRRTHIPLSFRNKSHLISTIMIKNIIKALFESLYFEDQVRVNNFLIQSNRWIRNFRIRNYFDIIVFFLIFLFHLSLTFKFHFFDYISYISKNSMEIFTYKATLIFLTLRCMVRNLQWNSIKLRNIGVL